MLVDVVDLNNQKVGEIDLADRVFAAEVNDALITFLAGLPRE